MKKLLLSLLILPCLIEAREATVKNSDSFPITIKYLLWDSSRPKPSWENINLTLQPDEEKIITVSDDPNFTRDFKVIFNNRYAHFNKPQLNEFDIFTSNSFPANVHYLDIKTESLVRFLLGARVLIAKSDADTTVRVPDINDYARLNRFGQSINLDYNAEAITPK